MNPASPQDGTAPEGLKEAVARIIDPGAWRGIDRFYETGGGRELYGSWENCLKHSANAPVSLSKAEAILALIGSSQLSAAPATVLCGGDMSSVAESALSLHGDSTETEGP